MKYKEAERTNQELKLQTQIIFNKNNNENLFKYRSCGDTKSISNSDSSNKIFLFIY